MTTENTSNITKNSFSMTHERTALTPLEEYNPLLADATKEQQMDHQATVSPNNARKKAVVIVPALPLAVSTNRREEEPAVHTDKADVVKDVWADFFDECACVPTFIMVYL